MISLDDLTAVFNEVAALGDPQKLADYIHSIDVTALDDEALADELQRRRDANTTRHLLAGGEWGDQDDPRLTGGVDWPRMVREAEAELARRQLPQPEKG